MVRRHGYKCQFCAGAVDPGVCILCAPGTYQPEAGQPPMCVVLMLTEIFPMFHREALLRARVHASQRNDDDNDYNNASFIQCKRGNQDMGQVWDRSI